MAIINLKRPADLLGRSVVGSYRLGGYEFEFSGVVECLVLPAPGNTDHHVEFFVCGEFVSLSDCLKLDYLDTSRPVL